MVLGFNYDSSATFPIRCRDPNLSGKPGNPGETDPVFEKTEG